MLTRPDVPSATVAALAATSPGSDTLTSLVSGWLAPAGNTVAYPAASGSVIVRLSAAAMASGGTTPPVTVSEVVLLAPGFTAGAPRPMRVSRMRVGCTGTKRPGPTGGAGASAVMRR